MLILHSPWSCSQVAARLDRCSRRAQGRSPRAEAFRGKAGWSRVRSGSGRSFGQGCLRLQSEVRCAVFSDGRASSRRRRSRRTISQPTGGTACCLAAPNSPREGGRDGGRACHGLRRASLSPTAAVCIAASAGATGAACTSPTALHLPPLRGAIAHRRPSPLRLRRGTSPLLQHQCRLRGQCQPMRALRGRARVRSTRS